MDVKQEMVRGVTRRRTATNLSFCVKKERDVKYRKVYSAVQKNEEDLTEEERELLRANVDLVNKARESQKKREEVKARSDEVEDPEEILIPKCAELAAALRNSRHLVVYTGAGISTAAKIPDYRGSNGIWTLLQKGKEIGKHDLSRAEPTMTHMALYELYRKGILKYVVSQNCDGLHLRSGLPRSALSEVHGNMHLEVCRECRPGVQYWRMFDVTENTGRFTHRTMRRCHMCHSALIDTIVHFGERGNLPWPLNWPGACKAADNADVILCIGSSLKVLKKYPWLWGMDRPVRKRPKLYIINLQWTPKDDQAALKINGRCDRVMQEVMKCLEIPIPFYDRLRDPIFCHATHLHPDEGHTTSQPELDSPFKEEVCVHQDSSCKEENSRSFIKRNIVTAGSAGEECPMKMRKLESPLNVVSEVKVEEILVVDGTSLFIKPEADVAGIEVVDGKNENFPSCLNAVLSSRLEWSFASVSKPRRCGEDLSVQDSNMKTQFSVAREEPICAIHCEGVNVPVHNYVQVDSLGRIERTMQRELSLQTGCSNGDLPVQPVECEKKDLGSNAVNELPTTSLTSADPICSENGSHDVLEGSASADGKENVNVLSARVNNPEIKVTKKAEVEKLAEIGKDFSKAHTIEIVLNGNHCGKVWVSQKVHNSMITDSSCDTGLDSCFQGKAKSLKVNGSIHNLGETYDEDIGVLRMLQLEHNYSKSCDEKCDKNWEEKHVKEDGGQERQEETQQLVRTSSRVREKQNAIQAQVEAERNAKSKEKSSTGNHSRMKHEKKSAAVMKNKKLTKADFEMQAELKSKTCTFCQQYYASSLCLFYPSLDSHPRKFEGCICECCDFSSESEEEVEEDGSGADTVDNKGDSTDNAEEGTSKTSFLNPGWYGKGYRKKFRKRK